MSWLKSPHPGNRPQVFAVALLAIVLAGCATLKQCAYEGFDRDQWQQPERVIQSLQIRPGAVVADLGSGSGYFALRLAKAVGTTGKVYAVDIDSAINEALKERAKKEQAGNIAVLLAKPNDPRLPEPVDLIFTSNTYHHIDNRISYFAGLREYLRPSGKIAVIDYDRRAWLEGLLRHYTPKEFIKREMEQAGYELQNDFDFLERQSFLVFVPSSDAPQ
ncbi:MAG: methyltransferase domain-containing protein [Candidatus Binatia bacterium]